MIRRRRGKIINVTSIAAILAFNHRAIYNVTKAGVAQLTKCLALEWAPYNVQVNAIGPGIIQTSLNREYLVRHRAKRRLMEHKIPLGRLGRPGDLVGAAIFLAAPRIRLHHRADAVRRWWVDDWRCGLVMDPIRVRGVEEMDRSQPRNATQVGRRDRLRKMVDSATASLNGD